MIYGGGVSSLKTVEVLESGICLGVGLTISEMEQKLEEITVRIPGKCFINIATSLLIFFCNL